MPVFIVFFFSLIVYIVKNIVFFGINKDSISEIIKGIIQIFISQYSFKFTINVPMWFVLCLFVVEILFYIKN